MKKSIFVFLLLTTLCNARSLVVSNGGITYVVWCAFRDSSGGTLGSIMVQPNSTGRAQLPAEAYDVIFIDYDPAIDNWATHIYQVSTLDSVNDSEFSWVGTAALGVTFYSYTHTPVGSSLDLGQPIDFDRAMALFVAAFGFFVVPLTIVLVIRMVRRGVKAGSGSLP